MDRRETARKREQEGDPQGRSETTGKRQGVGGARESRRGGRWERGRSYRAQGGEEKRGARREIAS